MNEIEQIKQKLDIVDFIGNYLELKKAGSNYKALCPFHEEKTPSFMVSAEKQIFKCFGCGESGSIFDFLMKYENLEFPEALKILADKAGVQLQPRKGRPAAVSTPDRKTKLYRINALSSQAFHKILLEHQTAQFARDYLKKRKIKPETITTFQLGYAPRSQGWLEEFLKTRGFNLSEINSAGSPQRFYHRLIFPLTDVLGNTIGFTGRALDDEMQPKYLNTAETPLFHKSRLLYGYYQARQAIKQKKYAILVEGQMDVILAHQAGTKNTLACSGTALTRDHLKILNRITSNLILGLDQDQAGQKAASQIINLAQDFDFNIKLIQFPPDIKDPGEAIEKDPQIWRQSLKNSLYFIEWLVAQKLKDLPATLTVAQKKDLFKQILPYVKIIRDPIEKSHWVNFLSSQLQTPQQSVWLALERIQQKSPSSKTSEAPPPAQPQLPAPEIMLAIFHKIPNLKKNYPELYKTLFKKYNYKEDKLLELELILEKIYPDLSPSVLEQELKNLSLRIQQRDQEAVKQDFAQKISQAESSGDRRQVKKLLQQLQSQLK